MVNFNVVYDVVVVGAGPAGIAAAISAARNGAKILLIERYGSVGGMSTGGFLNLWCGDASSGILSEIKEKTVVRRGSRSVYNPEDLKCIYIEELEKNNVDLLLHAPLCEVVLKGDKVDSIMVLGKNGKKSVKGKIFIDSTGDGDLAYMAGVSFTKGRESDGLMQPMSLMFMVGGVDEEKAVYPTFGTHPQLEELMQKEIKEGRITPPSGHVILIQGYNKGTASVNMTNLIKVDGTEMVDLTRAEIHTRKQILPIVDFLRRCVPGYENCYLLSTADFIGVRETRHFEGEYTINESHILENFIFEDWLVSRAHFVFGNHSLTGSGSDVNNLKYNGRRYTIPYGCFVAKGVDNLYLNGRCISGTHMAHSSFRVMPICCAMGQGVGTAAALCIKKNISIREVDVKEVQGILLSQGVEVPVVY